ncbi:MAG: L-threonylcarbamoyladenylate synthase [Candidatus Eremiobacteraeota bacterium]|nr:L-threonylcarbamoyladenylate synthase [Candidatus Eremiobacteraeota bacterium]
MNVAAVIDARGEDSALVADAVAKVIFAGGTVIFPTDTVYGIACDPQRSDAIDRIYGAKKRPDNKPLSLHLASVREFLEYASSNSLAVLAAKRLLPGAVTLIIRRPDFINEDVSAGLPTVGFRVPDDQLCQVILDRCGPLAATSANTSGAQPYFGDGDWDSLPPADLLIENGPTRRRAESSVIDISGLQPRLLREGVVSLEELSRQLGPVVRQTTKVRNS